MRKAFHLDRANGKLMGVCAGLADYTGWDVTWIRVGAVLVTLFGAFPWTLVAYGAVALLAKARPAARYASDDLPAAAGSAAQLRASMRDIDRRMAEVETYVTSSNNRLAQEIDSLR
jgi:phage shock protein C